jgi:large subunit ribosomal protein L25
MEEIIIKAVRRDVIGKQVKALRREGKLPAVLYGRHITPTPILMELRESSRILAQSSSSSLITIDLGDEKHVALVREKQRNFLTGGLLHVDFQAVSMLERLRTNVSINFEGESPAVKTYNAIVMTELSEVEVECLPIDLPSQFSVDISGLTEIGSAIYVKDLDVPDAVEILEDPDAIVVVITAAAYEEEVVVEAETPLAAEPEVIEKGKKEEEEF